MTSVLRWIFFFFFFMVGVVFSYLTLEPPTFPKSTVLEEASQQEALPLTFLNNIPRNLQCIKHDVNILFSTNCFFFLHCFENYDCVKNSHNNVEKNLFP